MTKILVFHLYLTPEESLFKVWVYYYQPCRKTEIWDCLNFRFNYWTFGSGDLKVDGFKAACLFVYNRVTRRTYLNKSSKAANMNHVRTAMVMVMVPGRHGCRNSGLNNIWCALQTCSVWRTKGRGHGPYSRCLGLRLAHLSPTGKHVLPQLWGIGGDI